MGKQALLNLFLLLQLVENGGELKEREKDKREEPIGVKLLMKGSVEAFALLKSHFVSLKSIQCWGLSYEEEGFWIMCSPTLPNW